MKLIVCLDDRDGMLFAGRRQSRDKAVYERMLELAAQSKLWMNAYSARLFSVGQENICINENFLELANGDDCCFVENTDVTSCLPRVQTLIVFRWNRHYPADVYFPGLQCWKKASAEDFPGNSHDRITMEVYKR